MTRERELAAMLRRFQCEHRDFGICPTCAMEAGDAIGKLADRSECAFECLAKDFLAAPDSERAAP